MAKPIDSGALMDRILRLIDQDTKRLKNITRREAKTLDKDSAATLCRYATTISAINAEKKDEIAAEKRRLERLSTDELIEMHKKRKETP